MSEPCSVCGTDLKKPYKHTRIASVSSMEWKDYNKKNPKVIKTESVETKPEEDVQVKRVENNIGKGGRAGK